MEDCCTLCENAPEFQCLSCGKPVCGQHTKFRVVCEKCLSRRQYDFAIRAASDDDAPIIHDFVMRFWGDPEQLMFEKTFTVTQEPARVAVCKGNIIGFISYTNFEEDAILIVALAVQSSYQGCGIGKALIDAIEEHAKKERKTRILVVTSNDDLPALAFYQRQGFQLFEVVPDVIAEKLGGIMEGIGKIPIRDELRLRKILA